MTEHAMVRVCVDLINAKQHNRPPHIHTTVCGGCGSCAVGRSGEVDADVGGGVGVAMVVCGGAWWCVVVCGGVVCVVVWW